MRMMSMRKVVAMMSTTTTATNAKRAVRLCGVCDKMSVRKQPVVAYGHRDYVSSMSWAPLMEDTTSMWPIARNALPGEEGDGGGARGGMPTHPRISELDMRSYSRQRLWLAAAEVEEDDDEEVDVGDARYMTGFFIDDEESSLSAPW